MFIWRGLCQAVKQEIMRQSGACVSSTFPPLGIAFWPFHSRQLTAVKISPNHLLNPSMRRSLYRLRFVLDGMRSLFRLVVLKCIFMFESNSLCKSEKLAAFFWYRQGQKGTGSGEIYIFLTVWRNKGTWVHCERCIPDVWCWWWLLIYWILRVSFIRAKRVSNWYIPQKKVCACARVHGVRVFD